MGPFFMLANAAPGVYLAAIPTLVIKVWAGASGGRCKTPLPHTGLLEFTWPISRA